MFGEGLRGPIGDAIRMRPTKAERVCMDSLLEGDGFEPSVPRDMTKVSKPSRFAAAALEVRTRLRKTDSNRWSPVKRDGVFRDHPDRRPPLRLPENQARGTEGSNPACSSGESSNYRFCCRGSPVLACGQNRRTKVLRREMPTATSLGKDRRRGLHGSACPF